MGVMILQSHTCVIVCVAACTVVQSAIACWAFAGELHDFVSHAKRCTCAITILAYFWFNCGTTDDRDCPTILVIGFRVHNLSRH
jgi:hypothetical protein